MYYSHRVSGMHGKITRLLACSQEQSAKYTGWDLGPTFVHENFGHMQQTRELQPGETKAPYGSRKTDRRECRAAPLPRAALAPTYGRAPQLAVVQQARLDHALAAEVGRG